MNNLHTSESRDRVAEWMRELAAAPSCANSLPDPYALWWKAQALRRLDKQRERASALERTDRFQLVCSSVAAIGMSVWLVVAAPESRVMGALALTFLIGGVIAASAITLTAWSERRN